MAPQEPLSNSLAARRPSSSATALHDTLYRVVEYAEREIAEALVSRAGTPSID